MIVPSFIPSPPQNGFYLGPLFVHAYGLAYVFAVAGAIFVTRWRWRKVGGDPDICYEAAAWGFPAGLIGGRRYFVITTPSQIEPHNVWGIFAIWKGGLGIWGGIACGVAVGAWVLSKRLTHGDLLRFMDATAPGLLVAQAIGRIGNYFNQELFGKPSTLPWALKISPAHRPAQYARFATFQPSFLYEIIWNLSLAGFLIWLGNRRKIKPPGLLALYVAGYAGYRIFEETIRIDYSVHILGMRLNFWIATLVCLAGFAWFVWIQRRGKYDPLPLDGPRTDPRVVTRRRPTAPYRKPPAPTYGKKSSSGARPTSRSGGRRRGADP
ncbi:MAG TPA: prolipoprotein diacylglyceryl transferase [Solirubrobacteraceae bacterium]|nr:prolipoprotein diacylglyceryl transferase [Solirubrobacteraceae bacterium]